MKDHNFKNATKEEVNGLQLYLTECLIDWLKYHECAGSTSQYNLYSAVQQAVRLASDIPVRREAVVVELTREG